MTTPDYSTTRRLTSEKPACFDTPVDGMQTLLKTPDSEHKIAEGGLRLQGLYKTSSEDKPLITVVTVVYNGAEFLEETIKSVIEQTYDNVEYIIVDGGSYDGTLDIIKKYEHAIDYWVSESDKGIYDAMNKGIGLAGGVFINFMNGGDSFYDSDTLTFVKSNIEADVEIFTGKAIYSSGKVFLPRLSGINLKNQMHHQSTFYRVSLYKEYGLFDLCFNVLADYDFNLRCCENDVSVAVSDRFLSLCADGGVSTSGRWGNYKEEIMIRSKNLGLIKALPFIFYSLFRFVLKKSMAKVLR